MSRLNWFVVKDAVEDLLEQKEEPVTSREIWEEAKNEKDGLNYSTVKNMLKKLIDGTTNIKRRKRKGAGNVYEYYTRSFEAEYIK